MLEYYLLFSTLINTDLARRYPEVFARPCRQELLFLFRTHTTEDRKRIVVAYHKFALEVCLYDMDVASTQFMLFETYLKVPQSRLVF